MENSIDDKIDYLSILEIIKKRFLYILLITIISVSVTGFYSAGKKDEFLYNGKINLKVGYISYYDSSNIENFSLLDKSIKELFVQHKYFIDPNILINYINTLGVSASFLWESKQFLITYENKNEEKLKVTISNIKKYIMDTTEKFKNIEPKGFEIYFPKVLSEEYSTRLINQSAQTLKMKIIVSFIMGIIFSTLFFIMLENFLQRVKK